MPKIDRLSALMSRFELSVRLTQTHANFCISGSAAAPEWVSFGEISCDGAKLFQARIDWGGQENPLLSALPETIRCNLAQDTDMQSLVGLLLAEHTAERCGAASVLNRLCEVLIVRLLRKQMEQGTLAPGILRGLSDPRLSRAIVAIHNRPDIPWRADTLAAEAGLSVSRFAELFKSATDETPLAYLRRWRLVLARQDIEKGERIQRVASRYCYGSTEALSRAISQNYGCTPSALRKAARAEGI